MSSQKIKAILNDEKRILDSIKHNEAISISSSSNTFIAFALFVQRCVAFLCNFITICITYISGRE